MEKMSKNIKRYSSNKPKRALNRWFIILLCSIILIITGFIYIPNYFTKKELANLGYSKNAISSIYQYNLEKKLIEEEIYSDHLNSAITADNFRIDDLDFYLKTDKITNQEWFYYDLLQSRDYSKDESLKLMTNLEIFEITPIFVYSHIDDISSYITDCKEHRSENSFDSFTLTNSYINYYDLEDSTQVSDPDSITKLVNKNNYLTEDFTPNLVDASLTYSSKGTQLEAECYDQVILMIEAMKKDGLNAYVGSGFRPYSYQKELFDKYVNQMGLEETLKKAAKPGFSEHQTGLAVDMVSGTNGLTSFKVTGEYEWMLENAANYGFILRYPENKTSITGYGYESWHWRYVGVDLAKKVKDSNLTYDEYYQIFLLDSDTTNSLIEKNKVDFN